MLIATCERECLVATVSQFDVGISRKVLDFDHFSCLVFWIQGDFVTSMILAFVEAVPVVPGHADDVAHSQVHLGLPTSLMFHECNLLMFVLASEIPVK